MEKRSCRPIKRWRLLMWLRLAGDTPTSNHASRTRRGKWHFSPKRSLRLLSRNVHERPRVVFCRSRRDAYFLGCNTPTIQVSTCRSTFRAEVKSHTSGARSFERDESQLNSSVREGKSDCRHRRYRRGNIGHVVERHGRSLQQETQCR